jgi:hypothetical protein
MGVLNNISTFESVGMVRGHLIEEIIFEMINYVYIID